MLFLFLDRTRLLILISYQEVELEIAPNNKKSKKKVFLNSKLQIEKESVAPKKITDEKIKHRSKFHMKTVMIGSCCTVILHAHQELGLPKDKETNIFLLLYDWSKLYGPYGWITAYTLVFWQEQL